MQRLLTHATELRRSPRLTSSAPPAVNAAKLGRRKRKAEELRMLEEVADTLRRCPRFSPTATATGSASSHRPVKANKQRRSEGQELPLNADLKDQKSMLDGKRIQEKSCRRSPRLTSTYPECKRISSSALLQKTCDHHSDAKPLKQSHVKFDGGNPLRLRQSPRLNPSSRGANLEVAFLNERRTSKVVHQKKDAKVISTSIELSNSPVSRISTRIDDTDCLRCSSEAITSPVEKGTTSSDSLALLEFDDKPPRKKCKTSVSIACESVENISIPSFIGDPIPDEEAQKRWGWRYELKNRKCKDKMSKINEDEEDEIIVNVKCHYAQADIGNCIYSLGDCAFIKGEERENHVGKIIEFFQTTDGQNYFRVQWFYRIQNTVVQDEGGFHDKRRLFYSSIMNDNLIDCIVAKANVTHVTPRVDRKLTSVSPSDFYYDMEYCVEYSTFRNIPAEASTITKSPPNSESQKTELALLDLYSGCGGMSTGLCLGAKVSSINLVTRWALDSNRSATESLKLNHPDTHVRNESAEDYLELLKEWEKLCKRYKVNGSERRTLPSRSTSSGKPKPKVDRAHDISDDELEVSRLVDICYGDPSETGQRNLYLKVRWSGYGASEDTWEPIENLSKCKERIQDFVRKGMKSKLLPLPGEVDVICGGPPCQGVSGYNRFRNVASPLDDERNRQIIVFMDIVKFLKPKYVLMENVVDILKFDNGSLGRYALSRLVHMNYQARLGMVAAGCYGLPQFRLRVFLWGAHPSEVLPQFPLPTHDVIVKYWPPMEFERNTVAYDEDQPRELEKAIIIQDAISDLPAVSNHETREEMPYQNPPETEFQRYIRSSKYEMTGSTLNGATEESSLLYDHRPHILFEDDYLRVCQIPKRKGANFRDLPGLVVGSDNVVRRRSGEEPLLLPSGKPLVPDYAFTYEQGKSKRPFARLWWDETVPTALTFPNCHNTKILHPEQDRVLSIREFARLQGFPDYYRFCGTVKARYRQIGNAVAVPVGKALGYSLGMAYRKLSGNEPLMTLPPKFSLSNYLQLSNDQQLRKAKSSIDLQLSNDQQLGNAESSIHLQPSNDQIGNTESSIHLQPSNDQKLGDAEASIDLQSSYDQIGNTESNIHLQSSNDQQLGNAESSIHLQSLNDQQLGNAESNIHLQSLNDQQLGNTESNIHLQLSSDQQIGNSEANIYLQSSNDHQQLGNAESNIHLQSLNDQQLGNTESSIDLQLSSDQQIGNSEANIHLQSSNDQQLGNTESSIDLQLSSDQQIGNAESNIHLQSPNDQQLGNAESSIDLQLSSDQQIGNSEANIHLQSSNDHQQLGNAESNIHLQSPNDQQLGNTESSIDLQLSSDQQIGNSDANIHPILQSSFASPTSGIDI